MRTFRTILITLIILLAVSFKTSGESNNITLEAETESALVLEDWMTNDTLFNSKNKSFGTGYNKTNFGRRVFIMYEEPEEEMKLENWMIDNKIWINK